MKFTKTINLTGVIVVEDINVYVNISYVEPESPTEANFNFDGQDISVSGNCSKEGLAYYSVSRGIVTDEFMKQVEDKLKGCLVNYESI